MRTSKLLSQITIGVIEFVGIPIGLAYLSTLFSPFDVSSPQVWQWIERTAFCFTVYQVIIIITRKLIIDARVDMLLALRTAYEIGELYCTSGQNSVYERILKLINAQLDPGLLNDHNTRKDYEQLKTLIDKKDITVIRYKIIFISHSLEECKLFWEYTLFLRLFK